MKRTINEISPLSQLTKMNSNLSKDKLPLFLTNGFGLGFCWL